ncbi:xanthine dehydrogenase family protein molybdopterin-binding subunit [Massilia sp. CF038]|uniref:xanthine dehydrogenase family protein molybdopterin-binding subunit n=1 Tax=Massilia sp. CF038 TaxID=1881045 RepID=UPI00091162D6|nr:xanthine dehydrogenase family protein molybdopterin-binding subunit [Massilia sp. CF038]SHH72823.1 xanthine dehydrogenase, molybdenum binding subunit apoprotein [Massilia sp. CF038]
MSIIGQGIDRTDGFLKVTGGALYSAEHPIDKLSHAVMVLSTIPSGTISSIDTAAASAMPGVLAVLTPQNAPRLPKQEKPPPGAPAGAKLSLLQDNVVHYNGQPIAVVVAESLEQARDAARHLAVRYAATPAVLDFRKAKQNLRKPPSQPEKPTDSSRGNLAGGMSRAAQRMDAVYTTPVENHNPMEPHATIAVWEGDQLTLHDSTQYVGGARKAAAKTFGIAPDKVRVHCPFVGGGFGSKGTPWSHVMLAAMASKVVARPVKLVVERQQMFGPVGARPMTEQHLRLGAARDGKLTAVQHDSISHTAFLDDFLEPCALVSRSLYNAESARTTHRYASMHLGVPTYMRAPGEASGSFALESALDELAYKLKMDPVQLRLQNYAETDPEKNLPYSSKSLRECYRVAAERFGWARRTAEPRSMREGKTLVGWGMATATYPTNRQKSKASAALHADGSVVVRSGTHDLGTGTYTVMTQIAADALGVPVTKVRFELGDTAMPEAPVSGGSMTVASVGPAVHAAATALREKLAAMAAADQRSPLKGSAAADLVAENGWLSVRGAPERREAMAALVARNGGKPVEADSESAPGDEKKQYSMHAFGAVFVEVHVDPELGTIRVPRVVGAYGVGKLINKKTGHSQLLGGVVWGLGMGLMEKTEIDGRTGRALNANLADYHVPVNADIGEIDVSVVEENDPHVNPLGAKGIGEIGIVGVAAALANAVYHATGKRIRDLPITVDKLV